jgi:tRNA-splicing ligase RtcB (3'-phosphate/5'-hydroxy nucleic acid ligase)
MEQDHYDVMEHPGGHPVKMWTRGVPVEPAAREQLNKLADLPFIFKHIAVMPDVHVGKGSTIGSVIPTLGAVIPAAVGVDIGCGMMAAKTTLRADDLPDSLGKIRSAIEQAIPHGMSPKTRNAKGRDIGSWNSPPPNVEAGWSTLKDEFDALCRKWPKLRGTNNYKHLGTLGSGNHFVELCLDEDNFVWLMLHSGSRGVGNAIGTHFIELARQDMRRHMANLPDQDLAYLREGTQHYDDYVEAVGWAQKFARINREVMMQNLIRALRGAIDKPFDTHVEAVNCHHNYVQKERHFGREVLVTRKGAVSAREGELGIIPGSMGARSFIVRGKGNQESFTS